MRPSEHGKVFNFFYGITLVMIVAVFGLVIYFLATTKVDLRSAGAIDPIYTALVIGGAIVLLALLTGAMYLVSRFDRRLIERRSYDKER